jgi:hypothetical protein
MNHMNVTQKRNPKWWNDTHESGWDRVKAAFKRDWDQTKHDLGGHEPDTDQNVNDTVKQAAGKQPIPPRGQPTYEEVEDAYRFGYGARDQYGKKYSRWDNQLESQLEQDWRDTYSDREWKSHRDSIRRGWDSPEGRPTRKEAKEPAMR